jgi:exosome complex component RRP4
VDEEMVVRAYEASLELEEDGMDAGGEYLGGERGRRVVEAALNG